MKVLLFSPSGTYRGTSPIRTPPSLGSYSRPMPRGGGGFSYERGTPAFVEGPSSGPVSRLLLERRRTVTRLK